MPKISAALSTCEVEKVESVAQFRPNVEKPLKRLTKGDIRHERPTIPFNHVVERENRRARATRKAGSSDQQGSTIAQTPPCRKAKMERKVIQIAASALEDDEALDPGRLAGPARLAHRHRGSTHHRR
ncbi:MAG: hypothetical protein ACTHM0_12580 [Sphingomonas sp.]